MSLKAETIVIYSSEKKINTKERNIAAREALKILGGSNDVFCGS